MSWQNPYSRYEQEARAYAERYGIDTRKDTDNAWDAFRHGYASAEMTREHGELAAHLAGYLNELKGDYSYNQESSSRNMDEWNNATGRGEGKNSKSSGESAQRVYDALKRGDLITDPEFDARHYEGSGKYHEMFPGPDLSIPRNERINKDFRDARDLIERRDPLALDLDGDGIETVGITSSHRILFDHDGDGIKTGTGWLTGDDAFLALDKNGNGAIDNGSELFGVDTVLANGQKASNGFAALAELDSNQDGQFSNADTRFADLRLWRDLNQDGLSQSDELHTLAATDIASINVTGSASNIALAGGNLLSARGSYTRSDGQTGTVGEFITGSTGNLDLVDNPFYREFADSIPLTDQAKALPDMAGSGMVRDLAEAVSLKVEKATNDLEWRRLG